MTCGYSLVVSVPKRVLVPLGIAVAGLSGTLAHRGHTLNDASRHETAAVTELLVMPSGEALKVGSLGMETHLADLLWVRTVLTFGERWEAEPDPAWQEWLARMIEAITVLDPTWRTPYFYGGVMLRVTGDHEGSNRILLRGHEALPDDYFFPFAIGMSHYLEFDDAEAAYEWLNKAAVLPGAPSWYRLAATGFVVKSNQRQTAIRFLREELAQTSDPDLREPLENKLKSLMHDELSERLGGLRDAWEEEHPGPLLRVEQLVGPSGIESLPLDPLGGEWVIDVDNSIVSSVVAADRARKARWRERRMLKAISPRP